MEIGDGFFYLIYPDIVLAIFLGVILTVHGICQYCKQNKPDKQNLFSGIEILLIGLSAYPFFLFFYPSYSVLYWVKTLISVPLIFFIPGYLLFANYCPLSKKNTMLEISDTGFAEKIFMQVLISVQIGRAHV